MDPPKVEEEPEEDAEACLREPQDVEREDPRDPAARADDRNGGPRIERDVGQIANKRRPDDQR